MMARFIPLFILSVGCVPLSTHQALQKKLAASEDGLMVLREQRDQCQERITVMAEELKNKPRTVTIHVPVPIKEIDPAELDAIKRQAFEEAEQKFRKRLEGAKAKDQNPKVRPVR